MRDRNNIDSDDVAAYYQTCVVFQKKQKASAYVEFPRIFPFNANGVPISNETFTVLRAYKQMAETWNAAGGTVPDPMYPSIIDMLFVMGCNSIAFVSTKKE